MQHEQIAFLLSLSALPLAGCVVGGDDDDETTNATTQTTMSTTDNSTSDTDPSTTASTTENPSTTNSSTTQADTGTDTGGTTGEPSEICTTYGDHYVECFMYGTPEDNATYCQSSIDMANSYYGAECASAVEDVFACLNGLDCMTWMGDTYCEAEYAASAAACGGGTSSDGGSSDGGSSSSGG